MKTYEKPAMEKVSSQIESLLIGVSNEMGDKIQLSKENNFIFDDSSEEDEL